MPRSSLSTALSTFASLTATPFITLSLTNCCRGWRRCSSGADMPKNTIVRSVNIMWVATMWNRSASSPVTTHTSPGLLHSVRYWYSQQHTYHQPPPPTVSACQYLLGSLDIQGYLSSRSFLQVTWMLIILMTISPENSNNRFFRNPANRQKFVENPWFSTAWIHDMIWSSLRKSSVLCWQMIMFQISD